jgi:hypothetical protein
MLKNINDVFIKTCTTSELTNHEWDTYVDGYNETFKKKHNKKRFLEKYSNSSDGYSFHALLINENTSVVGACTLIPSVYEKNRVSLKIALAVDLFILPEYRNDSLIFLKFYLKLKKIISKDEIKLVIAVPNLNSYDYWKNIVKFKDIGNLTYWALPVKFHNIKTNFPLVFNHVSMLYSKIILNINFLCSFFYNSKDISQSYKIVANNDFLKSRFNGDYYHFDHKNISIYYSIINEDGVNTAYLLYAKENGVTSLRALVLAVREILTNKKVDLILFVGTLKIFQFIFARVPKKFTPKRLPLICDILIKEDKEKYKDLLNINNWDFGLINYDVR